MSASGILLKKVYVKLLQHPHDEWRAKNQLLYCDLRDQIAANEALTAEECQNLYESAAVAEIYS